MKRSILLKLGLFFCLTFSTQQLKSEVIFGTTVELLTVQADLILKGKILEIEENENRFAQVKIKVHRIYKGTSAMELEFTLNHPFKGDQSLNVGAEMIVFLENLGDGELQPCLFRNTLQKSWFTEAEGLVAFSEERLVLRSLDLVEGTILQTAENLPYYTGQIIQLEARDEAAQELYQGSTCYVLLPEFSHRVPKD